MINKQNTLKENTIGKKLSQLIAKEKTINAFIEKLAMKSGVDDLPSYEEFLAYIKGRRKPKLELLLTMCNYLEGVTLESFLIG